MPVVRYAALAALVFWLGGTMQALSGEVSRRTTAVALACGGVMIISLFVMKFVGPPPRAFVARTALVVAMMAAALAPMFIGPSWLAQAATLALGFILLTWYAHE